MKRFVYIAFLAVAFSSCLAPVGLFEQRAEAVELGGIDNFYSTHIFDDYMSKELWFSPDGGCLQVEQELAKTYSGDGALHLVWDKGKGGCDWIGMGIGWDDWSGKNFGSIYHKSAISFKARTDGKPLKSLPIAMCLEDYGGLQAWTGFNRKMIEGEAIGDEWTTITIPLLAFNWKQFDTDVTNIKQFTIQFEASGDIYIDEIAVVEYEGSLQSSVEVNLSSRSHLSEGSIFDKIDTENPTLKMGPHIVSIFADQTHMHVVAEIKDETPLQNNQEGSEIWNGDAIEIAFSTNATVDAGRTYYLKSDKQIGIRASENPMVWDWRAKRAVEGAQITKGKTEGGYYITASVPFESLGVSPFEANQTYGLEVAIDLGDENGRTTQLRWNNPDQGGFHQNPALWGEMKMIQTQ